MIRRLLLVFAVLLFTVAVVVWSTGGFMTSVAGARVSARSPGVAAFTGALALASWLVAARRARAARSDIRALDLWIERRAAAMVACVAAAAGAIAVRYDTFSASGADASGYLGEAAMFASGALSAAEPLVRIADWVDSARTLAPLGWQAAHGATQVPTYAIGLPLLMAIPHAVAGTIGAALVVAASAALAVWFAGRLATRVAGGWAGVLAAVSLATLPVALYESMQPMSDVPVTAAWLACWWGVSSIVAKGTGPVSKSATAGTERASKRWLQPLNPEKGTGPFAETEGPFEETDRGPSASGASLAAGAAAAIAVSIRPNLAPLAAVPALVIWMHTRHRTRASVLWFAAPVAAAGLAIAYLHWRWFGSPLRSGYGSASEIYSMANIGPNGRLYFQWLLETNGVWLLAAPLALLARSHPLLRWLLAFAGLVCVAYFVYGTFEAWPYLRFLLPALALASIAVSAAVARGLERLPSSPHPLVMIALVLAIGGLQIRTARELDVFTLAARQDRAVFAGHYLGSAAPANAVLIAGEQSGAMRYYTGRSIVRWDLLRPDAFPQVQQRLEDDGRDVWIVLDDWEVALFRDKFKSPHGGLDWPPAMDAGSHGRTLAWRLRDRAPFLRGERIVTDGVR